MDRIYDIRTKSGRLFDKLWTKCMTPGQKLDERWTELMPLGRTVDDF